MARLMIGVSGVRGIYGDGLDNGIAERFAYAFGTLAGGLVVMGRDSRTSGGALARAMTAGLLKAGVDVIDLGIAATPVVETAVTAKRAAGGVIITASHNPAKWNGFKFLGPDGVFLDADEGARLLARYEETVETAGLPAKGTITRWDGADERHVDAILALDIIDPARIVKARFTVALDAVNGGAGPVSRLLLERLGCTVRGLFLEPTGVFPRGAEPTPENIGGLRTLVRETGADIGFAIDPDGDRLSLVDETGTAPGEEYTLALAADFLFGKGVKTAACNLSTSRMIDDAAARHGATVFRAPVGEINVVKAMRASGAGIGGEGNGGVIYPPFHEGRDALLGMALILRYMAETGKPLSALAARFPRYVMAKDKIPLSGPVDLKGALLPAFPEAGTDLRDGVKILLGTSWAHIRPSNTEPIVRIIAEAPSRPELDSLLGRVRAAMCSDGV